MLAGVEGTGLVVVEEPYLQSLTVGLSRREWGPSGFDRRSHTTGAATRCSGWTLGAVMCCSRLIGCLEINTRVVLEGLADSGEVVWDHA